MLSAYHSVHDQSHPRPLESSKKSRESVETNWLLDAA